MHHDSFICAMLTCEWVHSHIYVTWLIHMWHDSFICDMTLMCEIDMWMSPCTHTFICTVLTCKCMSCQMKLQVSFAEYRLFYRALLQKRPIISRSLLIVATPYRDSNWKKSSNLNDDVWMIQVLYDMWKSPFICDVTRDRVHSYVMWPVTESIHMWCDPWKSPFIPPKIALIALFSDEVRPMCSKIPWNFPRVQMINHQSNLSLTINPFSGYIFEPMYQLIG